MKNYVKLHLFSIQTLTVGLLLFIYTSCFASNQLYVIELKHRSSAEILQAISPILPQGTTARAFENKILLNAPPESYDTIHQLIDKIDSKAEQLRIMFYHGNNAPTGMAGITENEQTEFSAATQHFDQRVIYSTTRESERKTDEILVQSGEVAFIKTAVTIPLLNHQYAYQDTSRAAAQLEHHQQQRKDSREITLPAELGTKILLPDPDRPFEDNTLLDIQNPPTTNLPLNIPATPGADFTLKDSTESQQANTSSERQFQANQQGSLQSYEYHRLENGLHIRPIYMPHTGKVLLEILSQKSNIEQANQLNQKSYSAFAVQTTLMIPINQWVYMGGNRLDKLDASGYHFRTQPKDKTAQHLWVFIKTEE